MRVLMDISYIGTHYCGWQAQNNALSVQTVVERAFGEATGENKRVTGSSRTDAGVHAFCMRAHVEYSGPIPPERLPFVLNRYLPDDVRVTGARMVPQTLHARFQAIGKTYTYRIDNAPHPNAMTYPFSWHCPLSLDLIQMRGAASQLVGTYDFSAFAAAGFQSKTTVKTIWRADVSRQGSLICLTVSGSGFLYNMVRIIAGTLVYIGQGKLETDCITKALNSHDRLDLGPTAPPQGLELTNVYYSPDWGITDICAHD